MKERFCQKWLWSDSIAVSMAAYNYLFRDPRQILNAYGITIFVTVVGTAFALFCHVDAGLRAVTASFSLRRPLSFYVFFTLLFNGG